MPVLPIILLGCWFDGGFLVFGVLRSIIVPGAGIAIFSATRFRAAALMSTLWWYLRRFVLDWILLIIAAAFFRCATMYTSYEEVAVQRPVNGGF